MAIGSRSRGRQLERTKTRKADIMNNKKIFEMKDTRSDEILIDDFERGSQNIESEIISTD